MSSPSETRLLEVVEHHPLCSALRKDDSTVQLERSALAIPPEDIADNFTTGTMGLSHQGGSIAPAVLSSKDTFTVVAVYHVGRNLTGHVGYTHGGALATIFDECCGRACLGYFQRQTEGHQENGPEKRTFKAAAVTAQLSVSYLAPIPIDSIVIVRAVVDPQESKERKATAKAKLWLIRGDGDDDVAAAAATGLFISPKSSDG